MFQFWKCSKRKYQNNKTASVLNLRSYHGKHAGLLHVCLVNLECLKPAWAPQRTFGSKNCVKLSLENQLVGYLLNQPKCISPLQHVVALFSKNLCFCIANFLLVSSSKRSPEERMQICLWKSLFWTLLSKTVGPGGGGYSLFASC